MTQCPKGTLFDVRSTSDASQPQNALVRRVVTTTPGVKAVILAAHQTPNDIIPALEAGACGFLCQDTPRRAASKVLGIDRGGRNGCASPA
jgi:DNA-binding NarL/FixJ family response regulator